MSAREKVVLGMSGGVDSSAAALLLTQLGYEVIGVMLQTWRSEHETGELSTSEKDAVSAARKTAGRLNIPLHVRDIRGLFKKKVVDYFLQSYSAGLTPNPCVRCNRDVKWTSLLEAAAELNAGWISTGHYVRLKTDGGKIQLLRGVDANKDQSYFLSHLSQSVLKQTILPNGNYLKKDIKVMAAEAGLVPADRPESQDLCFLEGHDYRPFIARFSPETLQPGKIVDTKGNELGSHAGLANYTIGQRRGLGISSDRPLYVVDKDIQANTLILGEKEHLGRSEFLAGEMNWISGEAPPESRLYQVKIRSQAAPANVRIRQKDNGLYQFILEKELRDITPGQFAVVYSDELVLGGGVIQQSEQFSA